MHIKVHRQGHRDTHLHVITFYQGATSQNLFVFQNIYIHYNLGVSMINRIIPCVIFVLTCIAYTCIAYSSKSNSSIVPSFPRYDVSTFICPGWRI